MADPKPSTTSIIQQLAMPTTWNGTSKGQPLNITFSFVSSLPNYYNIDAIKATTSDKDNPAKQFVNFLDHTDPTNPSYFSAFNQNQQQATYAAMQAWQSVANITFTNAGSNNPNAIITLGNAEFTSDSDHHGITTGMGNSLAEGQNNYYGDIWLNTLGPKGIANSTQTAPGQDGYETILHELGHALGLNHTFGVLEVY